MDSVSDKITAARSLIDKATNDINDLNTVLIQQIEVLQQIIGQYGVIEIVPSIPYIALRTVNEQGITSAGRIKITNKRIELLDENDLNVTWIEAGEMSSGSFNFTELNPRYFNGNQMTGTLKWIARRNGHLTLKNIERS